jgi:hypothetical protein
MALLQIADLDPANPWPEVLLSSFSGGAHCCNDTRVLTSDAAGGGWHTVALGPFNGVVRAATDPLGLGRWLVVDVDNRFLYEFSSYAGSRPPLRIWQLNGRRFEDVSHQGAFVPLHRRALRDMESWFEQPDGSEANGVLAGYVATKALVGEFAEGWQRMLARYDRRSDLGLRQCAAGLGSDVADPCGRDWKRPACDWGDQDLALAIDRIRRHRPVPLVVFGHMHHRLKRGQGERRSFCRDRAGTAYLNSADVPRHGRDAQGRELRHFSWVVLRDGQPVEVSHRWYGLDGQLLYRQTLHREAALEPC